MEKNVLRNHLNFVGEKPFRVYDSIIKKLLFSSVRNKAEKLNKVLDLKLDHFDIEENGKSFKFYVY